jgi:hypothetical protein
MTDLYLVKQNTLPVPEPVEWWLVYMAVAVSGLGCTLGWLVFLWTVQMRHFRKQ